MSGNHTYHYVRVSTDKQVNSPEVQRQTLAAWQTRTPEAPPFGIVLEDQASAWRDWLFEREAGKLLLQILKPGDWLVAVRIDRLVRNYIDGAKVLEFLEKRKVKLVVVDGQGLVDTSNPYARLLYALQVGMGEIERSLISERTSAVLQAKKRANLPCNGDGPPYGYDVVDEGRDHKGKRINARPVINAHEMAIRGMIWKWHTDLALSAGEIQTILNEHGILRRGQPWKDIKSVRSVLADEANLHAIDLYPLGKHRNACNNRAAIKAYYAEKLGARKIA